MIEAQKDPLAYAKATIDELDYGEASHAAIHAVSTYALAYAVIALVERLDRMTASVITTDDTKHAIRTLETRN